MTYQIERKQIAPQPIAFAFGTGTTDDIPKLLGEIFPRVLQHVQANGGRMVGPPFTEYLSMGPTFRLRAGMPLAEPIAPGNSVEVGELRGGDVLTTVHMGPYDTLHEAYQALQEYVSDNGLTPGESMWEVYWTDPGEHPDPADWKTELFLPLA